MSCVIRIYCAKSQYNETKTRTKKTNKGGDNDPIDVIEISQSPLKRGNVHTLKVISVLGLIDEGELDWKIIGIDALNPIAEQINTADDIDNVLGNGYKARIVDWFQNYKVCVFFLNVTIFN